MFTVLLTALASLLWLAIMFIPLERAFPAREGQRFLRAGFLTDLAFFFGQHLAFGAIAVHLLTLGTSPFDLTQLAGGIITSYKALPFWVQIVFAIMLGISRRIGGTACSTGWGSCGAFTPFTTATPRSTGSRHTASTRSTPSTRSSG